MTSKCYSVVWRNRKCIGQLFFTRKAAIFIKRKSLLDSILRLKYKISGCIRSCSHEDGIVECGGLWVGCITGLGWKQR